MPVDSYHCKYCHQQKNTQTALNRHIAHSPRCFKSWQHDILKLSSTSTWVDSSTTRRSTTIEDQPELLANDSGIDASTPEPLQPSFVRLSNKARDDAGAGQTQTRYRVSYTRGDTAEILGEGKTRFQQWQDEKKLKGENDWAPFANQQEWDLARWLMSNVGQKSIDEYLKLPIVSESTRLKVNYLACIRFRSMPVFHFITPIPS